MSRCIFLISFGKNPQKGNEQINNIQEDCQGAVHGVVHITRQTHSPIPVIHYV